MSAHLAALARAGPPAGIVEARHERPAPAVGFQEFRPPAQPPAPHQAARAGDYAPPPVAPPVREYAPPPRIVEGHAVEYMPPPPQQQQPPPQPQQPPQQQQPPVSLQQQIPIPMPAPARAAPEQRSVAAGSHARARAGVEKSLRRLGVSDALAGELIDAAVAHTLPLAPRLGLAQAVRMTLAQRIPVAPPLPTRGGVMVLVGAGGAGKTTFCAALMAAYRTSSTLTPTFATITRGGEGGEFELILAPQIMKPIPATSPRARSALRKARTDGLAVIDTPRLTPSDRAPVRELARLLGELEPDRIVVALPATLGSVAAEQLLGALSPLAARSLVLTHADETDQIGVAVEAACRFELAPEFVLEHGPAGGWRLSRIDPAALAAKLLP